VLLLALGACESRYGAYFNVDGDGNQIRFDHVDLYFGKNGMSSASIGKPSGPSMGKVFERDVDSSDSFDVPPNGDGSLATESMYWLPVNDHNRELGYVAAVAYNTKTDGMKPVGIGEVLGFQLEDGVVDKYEIELQSPSFGVDVWGPAPNCFAWTRQRGDQFSTIAVLSSPDDADCDGLVASADCNDACPTGATTCNPDGAICASPTACGIGCAKNGFCAISACAPPAACMDPCAKLATFEERMKCASNNTHDHLQIDVNMNGGMPCARSFHVLPYQTPCFNPKKEWVEPFNDNWSFEVAPSTNTTGEVMITMDGLATNQSFSNDHHMLISCDPKPPALSRWSFIIGIQPGTSDCLAGSEPNYTIRQTLVGMPFFCP
jgi:hypothetical protein